MRLGVLGPAQGNLPALARTAQRLLDELAAERVIYLADDDALEQIVTNWARDIVGADPDEQTIYDRAAERCATASSELIDDFIASERARLRLKVFVSLPEGRRTIELLGGRVALFVYDRASLDEEDIAGASLIVYGKSEEASIKKAGARMILTPGVIGSTSGGFLVLDDTSGGVRVELLNASGSISSREVVAPPSAAARLFSHGDSKL